MHAGTVPRDARAGRDSTGSGYSTWPLQGISTTTTVFNNNGLGLGLVVRVGLGLGLGLVSGGLGDGESPL